MSIGTTMKSPASQYMISPAETEKVWERVINDLTGSNSYFIEKTKLRNRNYDLYAGRQWTQEEMLRHRDQGRQAYVFNEIQNKVDHLVGSENQTRLDSRVLPREKGDEAEAELLTFLIKWFEQMNDIDQIQTEVFRDGLVGAAGASVVRWENKDIVYGYPIVEKVPIGELRWDMNAKKPDLSDARWMARICYMPRYDAAEMYPDKQDLIESAPSVNSGANMGRFFLELTEQQKKAIYSRIMTSNQPDRGIIQVIEYYEKSKIYEYVVVDEIQDNLVPFDDQKEAQSYYEGLMQSYDKQAQDILNPDGSPRVAVLTTTKDVYMQTIGIGDKIAYYTATNLPSFPWDVYFAYFVEGDYWAFVDLLSSAQDMVNRFMSQWDFQLGQSAKSAMTVVEGMLTKGWNYQKVNTEISKSAPIIPVKDHDAIKPLPNPPLNPEFLTGIQMARETIETYSGGRAVLGLQESANASGRAVVARAEQGGIQRLPLFDKLRMWRKNVAQKAVWYIKNYMNPGQVARIIGIDDDVEFVLMDDQILQSLKEIEVDIHIDEAVKSETAKMNNFQQLKELFSVVSLPPEITIPMMVEYSSIPQSKKRDILNMLQFYQGYMQQKAEMDKQQKLTQEVEDSLQKRKIRESLMRAEQLDDATQEVASKEKGLKTKLDDIEKARMQMEEENLSLAQKSGLYDKLRTPQELAGRPMADIGAMR